MYQNMIKYESSTFINNLIMIFKYMEVIMAEMTHNRQIVEFTKMQATGNDFIIIENVPEGLYIRTLMKRVCDRHFGIGADGAMVLLKHGNNPIEMLFYNQDGSEANMCGNGLRCFALYAHTKGIVKDRKFTVQTPAGFYNVEVVEEYGLQTNDIQNIVHIDMGYPESTQEDSDSFVDDIMSKDGADEIKAAGELFGFVQMGVPHAIMIVDTMNDDVLKEKGRKLEKHSAFFKGTNINFVKIDSENFIHIWTWERGAGHTLSCGTGACACVWALYQQGKVGNDVTIVVPGGILKVKITDDGIHLSGSAVFIGTGEIFI